MYTEDIADKCESMSTNSNGGGSGVNTILIVIVLVVLVAFGVWYVVNEKQKSADTQDSGLQINLGSTNPEQ